jgi:hypothetical protein
MSQHKFEALDITKRQNWLTAYVSLSQDFRQTMGLLREHPGDPELLRLRDKGRALRDQMVTWAGDEVRKHDASLGRR